MVAQFNKRKQKRTHLAIHLHMQNETNKKIVGRHILEHTNYFRVKPGFSFSTPVLNFLTGGSFFLDEFDLRRLRLDQTLPIQETFGEDGSASAIVDFPTETDRFGNSLVLSSLQLLLLEST
ncbi:Uncharacterized protein Fot_25015 [Forsythia ovata]|uniref:Ribosomal protein L5 n=1 Tax=Forsythia ovata TaxID=205694 RepID=A0ABD1U7X1_9LAMI